jgi:hypothetical protein
MHLERIRAQRNDNRSRTQANDQARLRVPLRWKVIAVALIGTPLFVLGKGLVDPGTDSASLDQGEMLAARMMAPREPPHVVAGLAPTEPLAAQRSTQAPITTPDDPPAAVAPILPAASATEAADISEIIPVAAAEAAPVPAMTPATRTPRASPKPRLGMSAKREFFDGTILWTVQANQKVVKSLPVKSLADAALAKKIRSTQTKRIADVRGRTAG